MKHLYKRERDERDCGRTKRHRSRSRSPRRFGRSRGGGGERRRRMSFYESAQEAFARRSLLVLEFVKEKPFMTLRQVYERLLSHEKKIDHPFLPTVRQVHAALYRLREDKRLSSRKMGMGGVQWMPTEVFELEFQEGEQEQQDDDACVC